MTHRCGKTRLLDALVRLNVVDTPRRKETWPQFMPVVSHLAQRCGGDVQAGMDRLTMIGLNSVRAWMQHFGSLSNGQQERCTLALALRSRATLDDFGGFTDPHTRRLLAAGVARVVRKAALSRVAIASVDGSVCAWLQPTWLVSFSAAGVPTLRLHPGGGAPPKPEVCIRFDHKRFDSDGAEPIDSALALVTRHGARSLAAPVALAADASSPSASSSAAGQTIEVKSSVTIDAATVAACKATGLLSDAQVGARHASTARFVVPRELMDGSAGDRWPRWQLAVLLGASGSGKSLLLKAASEQDRRCRLQPHWGSASVADELASLSGGALPDAAAAGCALACLGLERSAAARPHAHLSAGQRCIADIAHCIAAAAASQRSDSKPICIDEFASVLDRPAAARACSGLRELMTRCGVGTRRLVIATVHEDVLPFLQPVRAHLLCIGVH